MKIGGCALRRGTRSRMKETDEKICRFAQWIIGGALRERDQREWTRQQLAARPAPKQRGKCDFCGMRDVFFERDL